MVRICYFCLLACIDALHLHRGEYPYAFGIALISLYLTFIIEVLAFRFGTMKLASLGLVDSSHPHPHPQHHSAPLSHSQGINDSPGELEAKKTDDAVSTKDMSDEQEPVMAQLVGVAILEFGVIFHSLIIGLVSLASHLN